MRQNVAFDASGRPTKANNIDRLCPSFAKIQQALGLLRPGRGFYALRHTFRTWADEVRDQHAIAVIMGHAISGMAGLYIEEIGIDRLRAVTEHVRGKLYVAADSESA